jgi:hypothetical protein
METKITRERLITFLLETPMFENLDPSEIMEIIHIVDIEQFQAGETVFNEGDVGDAWFVLYRKENNRARTAGLFWRDLYPGWLAAICNDPRHRGFHRIPCNA